MGLLNFSTQVPVNRTSALVQDMLVKAGASTIGTWFVDGEIAGLTFTMKTAYGMRSFQLPVNADAVTRTLVSDRSVPRRFKTSAQGARVAWRILKDWLEAQLAIIESGMVTLDEVMLPYMQDLDGRTVYDLYSNQQLQLESGM